MHQQVKIFAAAAVIGDGGTQVKYAVDRIVWLYKNRDLIGGLTFVEEPQILRFFFGKLAPTSDWQNKLAAKFKADLGDSL